MRINVLHLLWIVPLSAITGYMCAALMMMASTEDDEYKEEP